VIQNVANAYGKTATFMPKPIVGDNGSGMHVHQSVWKGGKNLFAGEGYAGLSEFALYYIGGIIKHARALNAITNPGTNSYKRLVPGFEAPVKLAYSARNRSASIRIPYVANPKGRRIEVRFPDPDLQPVPGLRRHADGRPGRHREQDPPGRSRHQGPVPPAAGRRREDPDRLPQPRPGLEYLDNDRAFLTKGGVFTDTMLDATSS
jgi:glutamine synthetase